MESKKGASKEKERPFLSVVTINRNNVCGLKKTIESVLSDTNISKDDLEYIIIDGGSSDGSFELIKDYASRKDFPHKIDYWVSEKDGGIYNAMNKGIKKAHGSYIAMLNSGDYYIEDALRGLKESARLANASGADKSILYGALDIIKDGKFTGTYGVAADNLNKGMVPHPATFVPNEVYKTYGMYDESFKIAADWDLFRTFKEKGVPFYHISKIVVNFDGSGISSEMSALHIEERKRVAKKHEGGGALQKRFL